MISRFISLKSYLPFLSKRQRITKTINVDFPKNPKEKLALQQMRKNILQKNIINEKS